MARKSRKKVDAAPVRAALYLRTALYVRLSVEDGYGRSNSIENQQMILNDFVSGKPEFQIVDTYIDNGLTGTNFDRPNFQRMLADIENGKINCVIVKDLSRLGRNAIDTGYYVEQYFVQHKIRFISVNDNYDTADESSTRNGIILPLKNMVNEAYALDIGKKIKSAAHQAMLDGDYIGSRAPFGYKKAPDNCHKLIIDEATAPIVRQIFEWAASGMGKNTIVVRLNEMGAVTSSVHKSRTSEIDKRYKKNRNWTTLTVARILENPIYTGDMVQGKSKSVGHKQQNVLPEEYIIVRDTHEAIISRELFERVQQIRSAVREEHKQKSVEPFTENIFKGKVFCPHCGKPLHRQRTKRKTKPDIYWLHCLSPSRVSKDACIGVNIDESVVMASVSAAIKERISALGKTFSETVATDKTDTALKKEKALKLRKLERVQSLIKGLYENLVGGVISSEDYAELKSGYTSKSEELKAEIDAINSEIERLEKQREQAAETRDCAKLFRENKTLSAELLDRLVERIEISHDHDINIIFRGKESL